MNNTIKTEIAVGVGNVFSIVDSNDVKGISLKRTDTTVIVENEAYPLYKGSTFEDSEKVDNLFDTGKYVERNINTYNAKNLKYFDVTVTRFGCIKLRATSSEEAIAIANKTLTDEVEWSDDWEVTDINEEAE